MRFTIYALVLLSWAGLTQPSHARDAETQVAEKTTKKSANTSPALKVPGAQRLNLLIRTTVVAVNHANKTGNYSVLRDLAAPGFQQVNTPARLALIFAKLRQRKLDLAPILFFEPKLVRKPFIQKNGLLRLSGFFDTRPERVVFDLQFQMIQSTWRLFGLTIQVQKPGPGNKQTPADSTSKTPAATQQGKSKTNSGNKKP